MVLILDIMKGLNWPSISRSVIYVASFAPLNTVTHVITAVRPKAGTPSNPLFIPSRASWRLRMYRGQRCTAALSIVPQSHKPAGAGDIDLSFQLRSGCWQHGGVSPWRCSGTRIPADLQSCVKMAADVKTKCFPRAPRLPQCAAGNRILIKR